MNSRNKGARGELEFARFLSARGFSARRGRQYQGSPESPDVRCEELEGVISWEVKRVEKLSIEKAMAQAIGDAGDAVPVVAHRRNHCEWLVTLRAEDFLDFVREGM